MSVPPPQPPPTPQQGPPTPDSQEVMWRRIAKEFRKEITRETRDDDDDFDDEANAIAVGIIVLGLIIGGFFLIRPFFRDKPVDPVYTKLEAIKHTQDLTLVKQHYTTLIPVVNSKSKDGDDLEFLLRAPVQVYGNIDLSRVEFVVKPDSLIEVYLPFPDIDEPYLDIQETEVFSAGRTLFQRLSGRLFGRNKTYLEAYDQIRIALDSASADVYRKALINDIEEETLDQAELYLRSLIGSLGYRVQFYRPEDAPMIRMDRNDSSRVGEALNALGERASAAVPNRTGLIRRMFNN